MISICNQLTRLQIRIIMHILSSTPLQQVVVAHMLLPPCLTHHSPSTRLESFKEIIVKEGLQVGMAINPPIKARSLSPIIREEAAQPILD